MAASNHPQRHDSHPDTYEDDDEDFTGTVTIMLVAFLAILTLLAQAG